MAWIGKENTSDVAGEVFGVARKAMMEFAAMRTTTGTEGLYVQSVAGLVGGTYCFIAKKT